ncbi:MAG: MSHA biogenesis protein MshM [Gammaproteobacteria bacterium]|jgi:MSHA biogenesis protein MshM
MYLEHFGLSRLPFKITPDTGLFFPGGSRGEILEAIVYAILSGEGIVKVVGEVGSGKTMLSRMLEIRLPEQVDIIYLANPSVVPEEVMHAILLEMGFPLGEDSSHIEVLYRLQAELLRRHALGRQVVCFVEEAQSMPIETLEQIRLLSNLETHQDKLLQIVLFGQPELDRNLDRPDIRQLRERIVHSFRLGPFDEREIREYVQFRMQAAGYRGPDMFTAPAYRKITRASRGLVRRVNVLGDKALLAAYARNAYAVTGKEAGTAIADSEFGRIEGRWSKAQAVALKVSVLTLVAGLAVAATLVVTDDPQLPSVSTLTNMEGQQPTSGAVDRAVAATSRPATDPVTGLVADPVTGDSSRATTAVSPEVAIASGAADLVEGSVEASVGHRSTVGAVPANRPTDSAQGNTVVASNASASNAIGSNAVAKLLRITPGAAQATASAPPSTPALGTVVASVAKRDALVTGTRTRVEQPSASALARIGGSTDVARSPSVTQIAASKLATPTPVRVGAAAPVQQSALVSRQRVGSVVSLSPSVGGQKTTGRLLIEDRLEATQVWLNRESRMPFTIQLMLTRRDNWRNLEEFLTRWPVGERESLFLYETSIKGRPWYGVLFNEYDSKSAARRAIGGLPEELKRHKPYVRSVKRGASLG